MKKMNFLASIILSCTLGSAMIGSTSVGAICRFFNDDPNSAIVNETSRYNRSVWLDEYFELNGEEKGMLFYDPPIEEGGSIHCYDYRLNENGVYEITGGTYCTVDYDRYFDLTLETANGIKKFIEEKYSDITVEINVYGDELCWCNINYPFSMPLLERRENAMEIKNMFGVVCVLSYRDVEILVDNIRFAGDVDSDSMLTADDASYVLEYYAKAQTDKLGEYEESKVSELALYGDYDGDGIVDANDASYILAVYSKNQAK